MNGQPKRMTELSIVGESDTAARPSVVQSVFAPFPPTAGKAAIHAAQMLRLFESHNYEVVSTTGPGLGVAMRQVTFWSRNRLVNDTARHLDIVRDTASVFYVEGVDFSKTSRTKWYQRRLEEMRKVGFMWAHFGAARETLVVLTPNPWRRRDSLCAALVGAAAALWHRKRIRFTTAGRPANEVFRLVSGIFAASPPADQAEATAYDVAFAAGGKPPVYPLISARAEQAARAAVETGRISATAELRKDVVLLAGITRKFDLKQDPFMELLRHATPSGRSFWPSRPQVRAFRHAIGASKKRAGRDTAPSTRILDHLLNLPTAVTGRQKGAVKAQDTLKWYFRHADRLFSSGVAPSSPAMRLRFQKLVLGQAPLTVPDAPEIVRTLGRDSTPFPISARMAELLTNRQEFAGRYAISRAEDRVAFAFEVLLRLGEGEDPKSVVGARAFDYFAAPMGNQPGNVSRFAFLLGLQLRTRLKDKDDVSLPWRSQWVAAAIGNLIARRRPHLLNLCRLPEKEAGADTPQLKIVGLPRSQTGVGSNLHMSARAFRWLGLVPEILDATNDMAPVDRDMRTAAALRLRRPVVLHHLNADRIPFSVLSPQFEAQNDALHIGFLLWEFEQIPKAHKLGLELLDEIWVPSEFLAATYRQATGKPVHNVRKGIHIPRVPRADLTRFGVPCGATVFLTCFDFHSSVSRKNPLAAVNAFRRAFPDKRHDVQLIVKTTPDVKNHWGDPEDQMGMIRQMAMEDPRIRVVSDFMPFTDLIGLIGACDCLISPHRAEGFGLMPAYALGLGVPVIATDYSGTKDFCTKSTALLVDGKITDVDQRDQHFPTARARWAEIDAPMLAATLRGFAEDPTEGRLRAMRGKRLIKSQYAPGKQAARYEKRLRALGVLDQKPGLSASAAGPA